MYDGRIGIGRGPIAGQAKSYNPIWVTCPEDNGKCLHLRGFTF